MTTEHPGPAPEDAVEPSETISDFLRLEKMSRSQLYKDWAAGRGPDFYYNGTHKRISAEAHRKYRRQREAEAREAEAAAQATTPASP